MPTSTKPCYVTSDKTRSARQDPEELLEIGFRSDEVNLLAMPRWEYRRLEWFGIIQPFEANSPDYYHYASVARSAAERLRDEVVRYLGDDSGACERWKQGCDELWSFVSTIQSEKDMEPQDQETESQNTKVLAVFKKLIEKVEHDQKRFHQMTYPGAITDIERDSLIPRMWDSDQPLLSICLLRHRLNK